MTLEPFKDQPTEDDLINAEEDLEAEEQEEKDIVDWLDEPPSLEDLERWHDYTDGE